MDVRRGVVTQQDSLTYGIRRGNPEALRANMIRDIRCAITQFATSDSTKDVAAQPHPARIIEGGGGWTLDIRHGIFTRKG